MTIEECHGYNESIIGEEAVLDTIFAKHSGISRASSASCNNKSNKNHISHTITDWSSKEFKTFWDGTRKKESKESQSLFMQLMEHIHNRSYEELLDFFLRVQPIITALPNVRRMQQILKLREDLLGHKSDA